MNRAVSAFCVLNAALLISCAKTPPALPSARSLPPLQQLRADIAATVNMPGVQRGAWGIVVHSLVRNERLFELNPRALLVPASTAKLASVAAASEAVGWDHRFETTLRATGPVVDGTLQGDLLVVGSGDPAIGGRGGDDLTAWIDALEGLGIRRIEGRVIGDDDRLEEPRPQLAWAWDDLAYSAGVLFGALNLAENRLSVTIAPGTREGDSTTVAVEPHATGRPLINRSITGPPLSPQLLWPEQRPGELSLTVAGTIPVGAAPVRMLVSVGNPTLWFASVLRSRAIEAGIDILGIAIDIDEATPRPDSARATVLYTYRSRTFAEMLQPLLKESINLYAEAAMRLNAASGQMPSNDAALEGFRKRMESWGIEPDAQQLVDGSGLSRRSVISAEALLVILRRMYDPSGASPFMTALPVGGTDGSLEGRMMGTRAAGNVRAKTGTMSNVRSLAGYVTTRDGEPLAFVVMLNNFEGSGAAATQAIDRIAVMLAEFSRE